MGPCSNDFSKRKASDCIYQTRHRYWETSFFDVSKMIVRLRRLYACCLCIMAMYHGLYIIKTIAAKPRRSFFEKCFKSCFDRLIERKNMYTKSRLRFSGLAFCVELWTKQVSYRISVPMSYITCLDISVHIICYKKRQQRIQEGHFLKSALSTL